MLTDKSAGDTSDIISDSSGVGTSNSDTTTCSLQTAGATAVCLQPYEPTAPKHIRLNQGDIVEGDPWLHIPAYTLGGSWVQIEKEIIYSHKH